MNSHKMTAVEMDNHGIDSDLCDGAAWLVTFDDGRTAWYFERNDGTFWSQVCNEDEIFTNREACHAWLDKRIN